MSYCDHPCCDGTHEDLEDLASYKPAEPYTPLCPETGHVLSMDEWIKRDGLRKRALKVGFPLPKKWKVPPVPLSSATNHLLKKHYLDRVVGWINQPSPLMQMLRPNYSVKGKSFTIPLRKAA